MSARMAGSAAVLVQPLPPGQVMPGVSATEKLLNPLDVVATAGALGLLEPPWPGGLGPAKDPGAATSPAPSASDAAQTSGREYLDGILPPKGSSPA
ncbi:MAG: hypothetical protein NVSMB12_22400 [Acidimicrobiales bacterium]